MSAPSQNGSLVSFETWIAAIASSACIGFTSLVPWLFNLTFFEQRITVTQKGIQNRGDNHMKYLLSFAIGAILGDIFFHLIPESIDSHKYELSNTIESAQKNNWSGVQESTEQNDDQSMNEKMDQIEDCLINNSLKTITTMPDDLNKQFLDDGIKRLVKENNNNLTINYNVCKDHANDTNFKVASKEASRFIESEKLPKNHQLNLSKSNIYQTEMEASSQKVKNSKKEISSKNTEKKRLEGLLNEKETTHRTSIDPAGYLNLIANGFDNFTHGLAIGASFLVGFKVGLLTTFVIIIHEIPHEICDFAILLKSGFSRWNAVKAQSSVSLFGIMGTVTALYVKSIDKLNAKTLWILPFSAGGFLYIALVNLLPEILDKETDSRNSLKQIACVVLGVTFMGFVAVL